MIEGSVNTISLFLMAHPLFVSIVVWSVLGVGMLQNLIYGLQIPASWRALRNRTAVGDTELSWQCLLSEITMPISIIVPAHNEEDVILESVNSLLSLQYPEFQVIVVNDGSTDDTLGILKKTYNLRDVVLSRDSALPHTPIRGIYGSPFQSNLIVVDKLAGGGKADAINAGINVSRMPLFCVVDADSLLEGGALLRAVRPFIEDPRRMVSVGGTIRVVNGCEVRSGRVTKIRLPKRIVPLFQTLEYIRAFLMGRTAFSRWKILMIISGAFGVFRREAVVSVGGFTHGTVGEDMEIIVKLHHQMMEKEKEYAMRYVAEPVCWTQAPETLSQLMAQRTRWQRGSLESLFRHKKMLLNPRYGKIGLLAFPYSFLSEFVGPIAEVLGYFLMTLFYIAGAINGYLFLLFTSLVIVYGVFISVSALILEEEEMWRVPRTQDLVILTMVAIIENFGYRQLNNIWRVIGSWQFLRGRSGWASIKRTSFLKTSS